MNRRTMILSGAAAAASAVSVRASTVDGRSSAQLLLRPYQPADGTGEREY